MMIPGSFDVADVGDLGVLQDRALDDQLAVLHLDLRHLHRHAGVEPRGEAGADLEAEQAAAEQRVAEALVLDDLGHRVDDRLGEALRNGLGPVDLGRAPVAERGAGVVGDLADDQRGSLAAQLSPASFAASEIAPSEFLLKLPSSSWRA